MKKIVAVFSVFAVLSACKTSQKAQNLPKDISLKPERAATSEYTDGLRKEILHLASKKNCTDASKWRMMAMGAKPCGGPEMYVAYPIEDEETILPKIKRYDELREEYNRKSGLFSDCAVVEPPSGIICSDGKAVLVNGTPEVL